MQPAHQLTPEQRRHHDAQALCALEIGESFSDPDKKIYLILDRRLITKTGPTPTLSTTVVKLLIAPINFEHDLLNPKNMLDEFWIQSSITTDRNGTIFSSEQRRRINTPKEEVPAQQGQGSSWACVLAQLGTIIKDVITEP